jgi:hypothetical protein
MRAGVLLAIPPCSAIAAIAGHLNDPHRLSVCCESLNARDYTAGVLCSSVSGDSMISSAINTASVNPMITFQAGDPRRPAPASPRRSG